MLNESDIVSPWYEATDHKVVEFDFDHRSSAKIPACLQGRISTLGLIYSCRRLSSQLTRNDIARCKLLCRRQTDCWEEPYGIACRSESGFPAHQGVTLITIDRVQKPPLLVLAAQHST